MDRPDSFPALYSKFPLATLQLMLKKGPRTAGGDRDGRYPPIPAGPLLPRGETPCESKGKKGSHKKPGREKGDRPLFRKYGRDSFSGEVSLSPTREAPIAPPLLWMPELAARKFNSGHYTDLHKLQEA